MRPLTGRELARLVEKHGWTPLRVKGSHHIYGRQGSVVRLSIPMHGSQKLKIGLMRHLLKAAGIDPSEIE